MTLCGPLPLPGEPAKSLLRCARAASASSLSVRCGDEAGTKKPTGETVARTIGVKSHSVS
jgi:hypothetical protein